MLEIRRFRAEDKPSLARLHSVVYNFRRTFSGEEKNEEKQTLNPLDDPPEWAWGVFENGKLLSAMIEHQYLMRFDGHSVPMSGIGGVGTLPEARKGGLVRAVFEKLFPEAYERGVVFSNLTPFSHSFYRKFGYETACARNKVGIPTGEFSNLKTRGSFTQVFPGDDTSALNEIHKSYIADINHGICRDYWPDNRAWKVFTQDDPYSTGVFIYIWRDEEGKPKGYIKYQDKEDEDMHIMSVKELAFTDRFGLYGVLSLVSGLTSQFKKFEWLMPVFIDPADMVVNLWELEQEITPRDMTRVINVRTALEKMRHPKEEGAYIIETDDPMLNVNTGRYLVEYGPEGSNVSLTNKDPDIRCDIPALSQLITGYRTLENALLTRQSGLEAYGNRKTLDKVFTLRPQHITEYF
ncbi:MAG: GNAT family N-acetyltransferase [Treponema sp.]|jgi:predicted acetyltransferase|nr:GNAT family N-acetyltransferase [Treponema sp.]